MASPAVTRPPAVLPANFDGWDKPAPKTLPADFTGWDKPAAMTPVDSRNGLQKAVDTASAPDSAATRSGRIASEGPVLGRLSNAANAFGSGAAQMLIQPLAHPWDTVKGLASGIAHGSPYDPENPISQQIQSTVGDFKDNGAGEAIPRLAGQAAGAVAGGKLAGKAVSLLGPPADLIGRGMQAASATPESLKIAATRAITPGSPAELLTRALKPPVTMPDFEQSLEQVLPKIASQNPKGIRGFADAANNVKGQSNDFYQRLKEPFQNVPVDASPIYNAQLNSIPITNQIETPKIFDSTAAKANNYKGRFPLSTLDDVRQDTNAKLSAFYNKSGGDKFAALSDPETARTKATNDASRDLVYQKLSSLSGVPQEDIVANQNIYGHASDIGDVANRRATVAGRANPMSLQESLALRPSVRGALDFVGQRALKGLTNSDAVTDAALDRFRNPNDVLFAPRQTPFALGVSKAGGLLRRLRETNPFLAPVVPEEKGARSVK